MRAPRSLLTRLGIVFSLALGLALSLLLVGGLLPALAGVYGGYAERYAKVVARLAGPADRWPDSMEAVPGAWTRPLPVAPPDTRPFRDGVLEEAAAYAAGRASDALLVMHRGQLVFERYWNGAAADAPLAADAFARTLTAILIGHAIADGRIGSVDDPAFFHLAEWDQPEYRPITIRHLLHMAAGLGEDTGRWPWSAPMQRWLGTDIERANLAVPVTGHPGVKFSYGEPAAQLLGMIVERATGRRYAEYLAEKYWRPLGARDAAVFVDRAGGNAHADCCLWTTIGDWVRVGESLRTAGLWQGERVIPAGWPEQMVGASPAYANFGMMLWLGNAWEPERRYRAGGGIVVSRQSEPFADGVFFLDGLGNQRVWVVPARELVIVRTGRSHPDWDEARIPNLLIRGLQE